MLAGTEEDRRDARGGGGCPLDVHRGAQLQAELKVKELQCGEQENGNIRKVAFYVLFMYV